MHNNTAPAGALAARAADALAAAAKVSARAALWAQLPNDDGMNSATVSEGLHLAKKLATMALDLSSAAAWHDGRDIPADMADDALDTADEIMFLARLYRGPDNN